MSDKKNGNGEYSDIKNNINSWSNTGSAKDLSKKASEKPGDEKKFLKRYYCPVYDVTFKHGI
ncbi:MAG: hypothetical protein NTV16_04300 [Actinobacteria bacterium]|nr:hypothetical protein [Actinomycetota bacterium]